MSSNNSRDIHDGGWYWVSKRVIRDYVPRTGFLAICVYHFLASMVDEKQKCFPSQAYIADHLGCSRSSISRAIIRLVEQRLIEATKEAPLQADQWRLWRHPSRPAAEKHHAIYHLLSIERFTDAINLSHARNSHGAPVDTNNTKVSRSKNNIVYVQESQPRADQPSTENIPNGFQPKTRKELLAFDIATSLKDQENIKRYLAYTERYPEEILRTALSQVKQTPDQRIKKSRVALFTYLLHHYGEKQS